MAVDAYAYGWQGAGSFGGSTPAAAPKYGTYSSYGYKSYKPPPSRPKNPRGFDPFGTFDPFGNVLGGFRRPPGAGRSSGFRHAPPGGWPRPATAFGEIGERALKNAVEKALVGYIGTQATPGLSWWSPFGLEFGPQVPFGGPDAFEWAMNKSMKGMGLGGKKWRFKLGRRRNWRKKRRRY